MTINGEAPDKTVRTTDETLRKLNHQTWLNDFATVLDVSPRRHGVPMTPFRMGAVVRLRYAAQYIHLLEQEAERSEHRIKRLIARLDASRLRRPVESDEPDE